MKTLCVKELRENAKWIVAGLLVMLLLMWSQVPKNIDDYIGNFKSTVGFAAVLFALFLGVMQSFGDFSDRQLGFLLHRSVSRKQILVSKVLSGATIYAIVMGIPLLVVAFYFAAMGPEYLPVRPLQVMATALLVTLCYFVHPCTVFMMTRPARWFGTKLLPLVMPMACCHVFCIAHDNRWQSWTMLLFFCSSLAFLSVGMFNRAVEKLALVANALTLVAIAMSLLGTFCLVNPRTTIAEGAYVYETQGLDKDGSVWNILFRTKYDSADRKQKMKILSGCQLVAGQMSYPDGQLAADLDLSPLLVMPPVTTAAKNYGEIVRTGGVGETCLFWDERGYFLVYENSSVKRLLGTMTRDGFSPGSKPAGRLFTSNPFDSEPMLSSVGSSEQFPQGLPEFLLIADQDGVYVLDQATGNLKIAVDKPISAATSVLYGDSYSNGFVVQTQDGLEHYQLQQADLLSNSPTLDRIVFNKTATYPKLPDEFGVYWSLAISPNGKLAALANAPFGQKSLANYPQVQRPSLAYQWLRVDSNRKLSALRTELTSQYLLATLASPDQGQWSIETVGMKSVAVPPKQNAFVMSGALGGSPLITTALFAAMAIASEVVDCGMSPIAELLFTREAQQVLFSYLLCFIVTTLISVILSAVLLRNRSTDKRMTIVWLILTIPFGLAAPLCIAAIYPKLVFEPCPKCDRPRRANRNKCEHCGANWDTLPVQGIEIIEGHALAGVSTAPSI